MTWENGRMAEKKNSFNNGRMGRRKVRSIIGSSFSLLSVFFSSLIIEKLIGFLALFLFLRLSSLFLASFSRNPSTSSSCLSSFGNTLDQEFADPFCDGFIDPVFHSQVFATFCSSISIISSFFTLSISFHSSFDFVSPIFSYSNTILLSTLSKESKGSKTGWKLRIYLFKKGVILYILWKILLKRRSFQIFFSFTQNFSPCDSHDTDIRFPYFLSSSQIPVGNTHWIFFSVSPNLCHFILCIQSLLHYLRVFHWNTVPWQRGKQSEKQDEITAESEKRVERRKDLLSKKRNPIVRIS